MGWMKDRDAIYLRLTWGACACARPHVCECVRASVYICTYINTFLHRLSAPDPQI